MIMSYFLHEDHINKKHPKLGAFSGGNAKYVIPTTFITTIQSRNAVQQQQCK